MARRGSGSPRVLALRTKLAGWIGADTTPGQASSGSAAKTVDPYAPNPSKLGDPPATPAREYPINATYVVDFRPGIEKESRAWVCLSLLLRM